MADVRVRDNPVRAALLELERQAPEVMADALNRTAFEILDAEEAAIRGAFSFAGEGTARFLGRGFFFRKASASRQVVTIRAKPKANALLIDHVRGDRIKADAERLSFQGKLAVPIPSNVRRSARGKVPKNLAPQAVTAPGGRGFVNRAGTAILQRFGAKRARRVRVLYALVSSALLRKRFDHIKTATETVRRVFPSRARRAIEKAAEKARAKGATR